MKKYSSDYFEKKYKILLDKPLQKEGFLERKEVLNCLRNKLLLKERQISIESI
jgi:hypothetical protein